MTVSVIIPSYNSKKTLEPVLRALAAAVHPALKEIILVDSSDDGVTGPWLQGLGMPRLRLIRLETKTGPATGRNVGARAATGDVLVFLDADAYPDEGWIEAILKSVSEGCRSGGGSVLIPPFQKDKPIAWAQYFLQFSDFMPFGRRRNVSFTPSCNLFCERALFWEAGGFPEVRAAEDVLFGKSVTARAAHVFDPAARVFHIFREDKKSYFSNQEMLGEYILRYRRGLSKSVLFRGIAARFLLLPGLIFKFMRIAFRVLQTGQMEYLRAWVYSMPLLVSGIGSWSAGYWKAASQR